jgi:NADPH:quinone reductase-like Zn-dependent oxidoreductase
MRAVIQDEYGTHDVLRIGDVDLPEPGKKEVRIRVHAAGIHAGDTLVMQGRPKVFRLMTGLGTPRQKTPGLEVAGIVDAVGSDVTNLSVGDRVFGEGTGGLAEYAIAKAARVAPIPKEMSFTDAAALPVSAVTGIMAMRDIAEVQPGDKVLVIGASGGVGSYAVQAAKHFGAEVTAVCSGRNADLVRSLGASHVVDYTTENVIEQGERFDVILDNVASHSLAELCSILTPDGRLLSNNGTSGGEWFGPLGRMLHAVWLNFTTKVSLPLFVAMATTQRLEELTDLVRSGAIRPIVGSTHGFDEAIQAVVRVESGHASGKTIVSVVPAHDTEGAVQ